MKPCNLSGVSAPSRSLAGLFAVAAACSLAFATAACAPAPAADARLALVQARAGAHVYHRPAPEIAAAVRAELSAEGYALLAEEQDGLVRTEWRYLIDGKEFATVRDRYLVLVKRLSPQHCRVEAVRIAMSTLGAESSKPYHLMVPPDIADRYVSTNILGWGDNRASVPQRYSRDLAFEWRLLRRADPEGAARLEESVRGTTTAR